MTTKIVPTICANCLTTCGINAHVEDGKLVKITPLEGHVYNKLCVKAQAIPDMVYAEDRLTHPLKKVNGDWKQISLNEALDTIADKLNEIKEKHGAKAVTINCQFGFYAHSRAASRFTSAYGTPNYISGSTGCMAGSAIGPGITISNHPILLGESYKDTRCIIVWGTNPYHSDLQKALRIKSAREKGAKLIVIDPRRIRLAKDADVHVQIRPGTDCALALGMMNVIIGEELYDKEFVKDWTVGFDELREHVKKYTPEAVEKITWVPAETIKEIARTYATSKPAVLSISWSVEHCTSGLQYCRAITILSAITGNLDVDGGNTYCPGFRMKRMKVKGGPPLTEAIGGDKWPLFAKFIGEDQGLALPSAILDEKPYPIKAVIIQGSNPCMSFPNSKRVREAFSKLDFLVVHDLYMTETAKLADIVIPAVFAYEQDIMLDYTNHFTPCLFMGRKAIDPPQECISDWKFWAELGRRTGSAEYFPWQEDQEFLAELLDTTDISINDLMEHPTGIWHHDPDARQQYLKEGFATPSGKLEIFSQTLQDLGYDPLPTFTEPGESLVSRPDLAEKYPFIMLNGTREEVFTNSMHHNIPKLMKRMPEPLIEINSASAKERGIANGDMVLIESPTGSIKMKAKVTDDIHPKVVSIPKGWTEANASFLISEGDRDPSTGYCGFRTQLCQISKAN